MITTVESTKTQALHATRCFVIHLSCGPAEGYSSRCQKRSCYTKSVKKIVQSDKLLPCEHAVTFIPSVRSSLHLSHPVSRL